MGDAHDPQYQVEQFEQSHAALVQKKAQSQVSADDIFGAPKSQAQLAPDSIKEPIGEVSAQDIFGAPQAQAQLAPEVPKKSVAEVSADDIFGMPNSGVQVAPARDLQS